MLLRPDGSMFAWTALPNSHRKPESISSSLEFSRDSRAIAFTAVSDQNGRWRNGHNVQETETVYLLRLSAHTATPIRHTQIALSCEHWASLAWHGHWLLDSTATGNIAVIDTTGAHRTIELGDLVRRLPGTREGFSASWSGRQARI